MFQSTDFGSKINEKTQNSSKALNEIHSFLFKDQKSENISINNQKVHSKDLKWKNEGFSNIYCETDRKPFDDSSTKRKIFYKGMKNFKANSYSSLISLTSNLKFQNSNPYSTNETNIKKNGAFLTERPLPISNTTLKNNDLKYKIERKIQEISHIDNFYSSFYSKFINKNTKTLKNLENNKGLDRKINKNIIVDDEKYKGIHDSIDMKQDRKFEEFFKDLLQKKYISGKIILIIENHNFETAKMKSYLKYSFHFISQVKNRLIH